MQVKVSEMPNSFRMDALDKMSMRKIHNNLRRYGKIVHDEHFNDARVQIYDVSEDNMLYRYCMVILQEGEVKALNYLR